MLQLDAFSHCKATNISHGPDANLPQGDMQVARETDEALLMGV